MSTASNVPSGYCNVRIQKSFRARRRRHFGAVRVGREFPFPLLLGIQEILPGRQQVVGVNLEASFDKKCDRRLPSGPHVQQVSAADSVELQQKFLQPVGEAA